MLVRMRVLRNNLEMLLLLSIILWEDSDCVAVRHLLQGCGVDVAKTAIVCARAREVI